MALTLTSSGLRREASSLAHGAGVAAAAASTGTIAGYLVGKTSRSVVLPLAVGTGGIAAALKFKNHRSIPFCGVGLAIGSVWSLFERNLSK